MSCWYCGVYLVYIAAVACGLQQITNPRIVEHPEDQFVAKNEPATLNCKAEGEPAPVISWYRNGQPVMTANENPASHRMLLPSGQLFFLRIIHNKNSKPDVGVYYCNATNPETRVSVVSKNATLEIAVIGGDFREQPKNMEVAVGSDAVLDCKPPKGEPEPRVRWRKDNDPVKPSDSVQITETGSIRLKDVRKEDSGHYVCIAYNIGGEKESAPARLSVREKPRIVEGPKDVLVQENSDVFFQCRSTGDPEPTIIWKKVDDGMPQGRLHILEDRSLKIERARQSDEGVYVCRAENSVGSQEAEAKLTVHSQPSFVVTPRDKTVGVGRRAMFRCEVIGNPAPAVFWNKESSQTLMFPNQDHGRLSVSEDGTLSIEPVQKDDAGEYICKGLNIAGTAYAKAKLDVKDFDPRPPPIIHQGPQNQTLPINSVAMLQCAASGEPPPVIRWYRNGRVLPMRDPRFTQLDSGTLQISDLRKTDTGMYSCKAVSETGETAWSAALLVETPTNPSIIFHRTPEPSTFPGPPSKPSISDVTETSVRLTWKTNTNHGASPVYAYTVEYFSHETGEGWNIASSEITDQFYILRGLRQDTAYMFLVRAQNSHGLSLPSQVTAPIRTKGVGVAGGSKSQSPALDLTVVAEKLAGQLVHLFPAEAMSSTAVKLSWEVKRNQRFIEGFHVRYRAVTPSSSSGEDAVDDRGTSRVTKSAGNGGGAVGGGGGTRAGDFAVETVQGNGVTLYTLANLERNTMYEIHVQPFYSTVTGQESNSVRVKTFEDIPSAAPENIRAKMIDNNTLYMTWEAPPKRHINGLLRGYKIYLLGNEARFNREIQINSSLESIYIQNIAKDAAYRVQMSAYNRIGEGVRSEPFAIGLQMGSMRQNIAKEPWFIATLIGIIGAMLWIVLCIFSIWLYRKRNGCKQMPKNAAVTVPVHKPVDFQRNGIPTNLVNGYNQQEKRAVDGSLMNGASLTNDFLYKETLYHDGPNSSAPPTTSFYPKNAGTQAASLVGSYTSSNLPPNHRGASQSAFRPVVQQQHQPPGYFFQAPPGHGGSMESCIKQNDVSSTDSNNGGVHNAYFNGNQLGIEHGDFNSSPMSEYGPSTKDFGSYGGSGSKHPVLYLPPPPEHPPPSDIGTPPDSPPQTPYGAPMRNSHPMDYDPDPRRQMDHRSRSYTPQKPSNSVGPDRSDDIQMQQRKRPSSPRQHRINESQQPQANNSGGAKNVARVYSPRAMSEPEYGLSSGNCGYTLVPIKDSELYRHYSDTEGLQQTGGSGVNGGYRLMMSHEYSPPSPAPDDPPLDDQHAMMMMMMMQGADGDDCNPKRCRIPMSKQSRCGVGQSPDSPISEVGLHDCHDMESDMDIPDPRGCHSPEVSISDAEIGDSVNPSMSLWDGVHDNSDNCSSMRSSVASSDGEFRAEADFASAVAKAAQLSGLTVVGSTVMDPTASGRDREKVKKTPRQRQRARCTSPYSTDSNYSAVIPHRPYPKSDRRRQLRVQSGRHNDQQSPANGDTATSSPSSHHDAKQRPPILAKPQMFNKTTPEKLQYGRLKSHAVNSSPSTSSRAQSDLESAPQRSNPLSAFDTRDTPVV